MTKANDVVVLVVTTNTGGDGAGRDMGDALSGEGREPPIHDDDGQSGRPVGVEMANIMECK